jgi:hypothetical protein
VVSNKVLEIKLEIYFREEKSMKFNTPTLSLLLHLLYPLPKLKQNQLEYLTPQIDLYMRKRDKNLVQIYTDTLQGKYRKEEKG